MILAFQSSHVKQSRHEHGRVFLKACTPESGCGLGGVRPEAMCALYAASGALLLCYAPRYGISGQVKDSTVLECGA